MAGDCEALGQVGGGLPPRTGAGGEWAPPRRIAEEEEEEEKEEGLQGRGRWSIWDALEGLV